RRPEGTGKARLFTEAGRKPAGSADDERARGLVLPLPILQSAGDNGAAQVLAALVQDHRDSAMGHDVGDGDRFLEPAPGGIAGAALLDLDDVEGAQTGEATGVSRAVAIALGELALRPFPQAADGGDHDAHPGRYAWTARPLKPLEPPTDCVSGPQLARRPCGRTGAHIFSRL